MVQTLARCRSCGLPGKLAERLEWRSGGVIVFARMKSLRLAMLDARTMDDIHEAVATGVGDDAYMRAEKDATRILTGRLMADIKGRLSRYGAMKKRALEAMEEYSLLLGMGRIEMERFTPGEGGNLILRKPFDLGAVTAGVAGALEEMDRCWYVSSVSNVEQDVYRLALVAMESQDEETFSQRDLPFYHDTQADGKLEGCKLCGLPPSISQLYWDEINGTVEDTLGGRRVAFLPAYMLAVLDQLGSGTAESRSASMVEGAVYASTMSRIESGAVDPCEFSALLPRGGDTQAAWDKMRMMGWGEVVQGKLQGEDWRIEVFNPVDTALITGWLRALYTVAMGRESVARVNKEPTSTIFELG